MKISDSLTGGTLELWFSVNIDEANIDQTDSSKQQVNVLLSLSSYFIINIILPWLDGHS